MRVVYEAENTIDAHLVRAWLQQAGLDPWIRGELLGGGIGELPAHGLVAVCVPVDQVERAGEVIAELRSIRERGDALDGACDGDGASDDADGLDGDGDGWLKA